MSPSTFHPKSAPASKDEPPWKLYRCPANIDPMQLEGFVGNEVPAPISEAVNDLFLQMKESDGFAHLHLRTYSRKGRKLQARWTTAASKQSYFERATFDNLF